MRLIETYLILLITIKNPELFYTARQNKQTQLTFEGTGKKKASQKNKNENKIEMEMKIIIITIIRQTKR